MATRIKFALGVLLLAASCNMSYEYFGEEEGLSFKVVEYLPAPGQFINEGYSATTMAEACSYAQKRIDNRLPLSLGGFGGTIVVKSSKPILNSRGYNFGIYGNPFAGSSEPGIVWVAQDSNKNGIADDEWFELYGSDSKSDTIIRNYTISYARTADETKISWRDNNGNEGIIERNAAHTQDYFPTWVTTNEYTLTGTLLPHNSSWNDTTGEWELSALEWGYADNYSPTDLSTDKANRLRISDARTSSGESANLSHIDFIKVQSAINRVNTGIGETSTEVCGFTAYSLEETSML